MDESKKSQKSSWWTTLKAEFKKVVWPSKHDLAKETYVVLITAIIMGLIIALIDFLMQYGIKIIMQ